MQIYILKGIKVKQGRVYTSEAFYSDKKDYTDIINKICTKQSQKTPSYIDSEYLTRDVLEMEVLKWLQKQ